MTTDTARIDDHGAGKAPRARRRAQRAARDALARTGGTGSALHRAQHSDLRHPVGGEPASASRTTADRILAEIGIEFRDDPVALDHWKRAGAKVDGVLVKFEPGMLREILKTAPANFTQHARNPANSVRDRRQERRLLAGLWLALRHGSRQGPPLRHDRGFPQLRQAGAVLALAAPFRRHDLRAGRRAGQQAPSRHGLQPHQIFRSRLHGLGDGRKPGGGFHRHGAHRLRRAISSTRTASSSATSTSTRRWSGTAP